MSFLVDPSLFYLLRAEVEELAMDLRRQVADRLHLPAVPGGPPSREEAVEAGEVLEATLGAVASATRRLGSAGVALGLSERPLEMQLSGELVGIAPETNEIRLRIGPDSRTPNHAETP
jgi:hypothetical protein